MIHNSGQWLSGGEAEVWEGIGVDIIQLLMFMLR